MVHGNEFNAFSAHKSMYLIVIAWTYVTLMMAVAEATSPQGTVLGAIITFVLYGLLPMAFWSTSWARRRASARSRRGRRPSRPRMTRSRPQPAWPMRAPNQPRQPRQMQAAKRPLPPRAALSRRCEKNLEAWVTVHQGAVLSLP